MTWLVTTGLTNAVLAAFLAGIAYGVGRWARRPALTHVLWVLVLIKLLTPPVFQVPIGWRLDPAVFSEPPVVAMAAVRAPVARPTVLVPVAAAGVADAQCEPSPAEPGKSLVLTCPAFEKPLHAASPSWSAWLASMIPTPAGCLRAAVAIWLAGSLWMGLLYAYRTWRFCQYLQLAAKPSAELSERLAELAWKARLASHPAVVAVESTISPMLFGLGRRALLIFPAALNRQLDPAARDTLLLHELAHYARRDHWVRLIEMLAQIAFWWHPVVWWARRELEACEEECCDAWVVERHAGVPRLYAEALLATIDFLCEGPQPLPPAACGLGDVPFLRLRLTQIVKGRLATQLSPAAKVAVFLTAMLILPVFPSLFGAAAVASSSSGSSDLVSTVSLTPIVETIAESALPAKIPFIETTGTVDTTPALSPTLAAINALTPPRRLPRLYGTAVSPDGRFKLEIREGYQVTLLQTPVVNQEPPEKIERIELTRPLVKCVAFDPDSKTFVAGHDDSRAKLYESKTGGLTYLGSASAPIRSITYSPRGVGAKRVAAGAADGSVIVWDVATTDSIQILEPRGLPANCVRWSNDGSRLAILLGDSLEDQATLIICSADQGRVQHQLTLSGPAGAIQWLDNDEALIIADYNNQATVRHIGDWEVLSQYWVDKDVVSAAQWSPNCSLEPIATRITP